MARVIVEDGIEVRTKQEDQAFQIAQAEVPQIDASDRKKRQARDSKK